MENQANNEKKFTQRLDFYAQAIAAYSIILVIFLVLYGIINEGTITLALHKPVVILMIVFIFITASMLLITSIYRRQIIIGENYIIFKNRFNIKKIDFSDIVSVKIGKSPTKVMNNNASIVRIKVKNKKKFYMIRTASFDHDKELYTALCEIKSMK